MPESMSLMFPELQATARKAALAPMVQKLDGMAREETGPTRALRRTPARPAEFADFPETVNPKLRAVLAARGIDKLYSHQAEAHLRITAGENVVIVDRKS